MQFERLKKNHKKEILIGAVITLGIISALTLTTTRAKYRLTQTIKIVEGEINYKPYDFKIMAMYQQKDGSSCTEDSCYNEITDRMPSSGYVINESKSYCTLDNKNKDTEAVLKTIDGNHIISNLKKTDKCYIWFDKKTPKNVTELIAAVNAKTSPTTFTEASTTDEGVYSVSDGMYSGTSYYWRGAATTNHVIFANKCWRIIRINGDKTIRLIYNGTPSGTAPNQTCPGNGKNAESIAVTSQAYNSSADKSNYVGWTYTGTSQRTTGGTPSNAKTQTEAWYNSEIGNNSTYSVNVADGKFCNDRNVSSAYNWSLQSSDTFHYAARDRLESSKKPTLSCPSGDVYILKAGAITADEVAFAGSVYGTINSSYYLYNAQNYWTMTSHYWSGWGKAYVFFVGSDGQLNNGSAYTVSFAIGIRPVINLNDDTQFQPGGNGTQNSPYIVN